MFSPEGPSVGELAVQALSSVEGGYDLLGPKFDRTPFRTVRAENLVRGSDQRACSLGRQAVMITHHVPAVRVSPDRARLIARQGGQHVLHGSSLALAAALQAWSQHVGTPLPDLARMTIR